MCGHDTSNKPRGGAIAVLSPGDASSPACGWCGELTFHTPGQPGSPRATHVRLTAARADDMADLAGTSVLIHKSGDMTKCATDCGLFHAFDFERATVVDGGLALELELPSPVEILVGDTGIVGRRVSMLRERTDSAATAMAEGIVGFNFIAVA